MTTRYFAALATCLMTASITLGGCSAVDDENSVFVISDPDGGDAADASRGSDGGRDGGSDGGATDIGPDDRPEMGADSGNALDTGDGGVDIRDPCTAPFQTVATPADAPPFPGAAYVTSDLITSNDPSAFVDLEYTGQGSRTFYDRRVVAFITVNAHLFTAQFGTTRTLEIRVNPEFSQAEAEAEARFFAEVIGRIPAFLFRDIDTVSINAGMQDFGGGNRDLLVHTEQAAIYIALDSLEEIFVHEASHASMDAYHANEQRWVEAGIADGVAISTYARDNPTREDVAESIGPYLAVRLRSERTDPQTANVIRGAIPNRLQYLDCLELTMDILR